MVHLIGDVHGHYQELKNLLKGLGYQKKHGAFHHPHATTVFIGDYINRGPKSLECLQLVEAMVEEKQATALLGNHEYYLRAYFHKGQNGRYLRKHNSKHFSQLKRTIQALEKAGKLEHYLQWISTLPIYEEKDYYRAVHACWDFYHVAYLEKKFPENCLSPALLSKLEKNDNKANRALGTLINGPGINLHEPKKFGDVKANWLKVKWWRNPVGKTYKQLSSKNLLNLPEEEVDQGLIHYNYKYPKEEKALFIGHYCLDKKPKPIQKNLACIDYCVARSKKITAYRFDRESELKKEHFFR